MSNSATLPQVADVLSGCNSVLIATHIAPDPDAIGSSVGLGLGLVAAGKEVVVFLHDPLPQRMGRFVSGITLTHDVPEREFDAFVIVDTATLERVGPASEKIKSLGRTTLNIDHHVSNERWADHNFVDASAAASVQIVHDLLCLMNTEITPVIAELLLAGLVDDTGSFRFSNTNAETFDCAAKLVRAGASPAKIANILYHSVPARVSLLRAKVLTSLKILLDGKVVLVVVPQSLLDEVGATAEDTEGLVEEARSIEGSRIAVLMRELEQGWKISFRAKDDSLDVGGVAACFGGGGHKVAAGAKIIGTQEEVEQKIITELEKIL